VQWHVCLCMHACICACACLYVSIYGCVKIATVRKEHVFYDVRKKCLGGYSKEHKRKEQKMDKIT
jgi:hypothetical protein